MRYVFKLLAALTAGFVSAGCQTISEGTSRSPDRVPVFTPSMAIPRAVELRFAVVAEETDDVRQLQVVTLVTDALSESGATVRFATGFGWNELGGGQGSGVAIPKSGLTRLGADLIVAIRQLGNGIRVRVVDVTGAPLLDQVIEVGSGHSDRLARHARATVRELVVGIMDRAQRRYPFGTFEVMFVGLSPAQEDQVTKIIHTLPEVQRAALIVRQNGENGAAISRWELSATNMSNVHLQSRIQVAVEAAGRSGRYLLDGREVRVDTSRWARLEAWVVGSRLIGFRGIQPAPIVASTPRPKTTAPAATRPASKLAPQKAPPTALRRPAPAKQEWKPW